MNASLQIFILALLCLVVLSKEFKGAFNANHELLKAAKEGNLARIKEVCDAGAYIEARNNNGVSAIILAANNGHLDIVKYLAEEKNANIEARSNDGKSALMWAARWGHTEVVKYFLDIGCRIDILDVDGMSALMLGVLAGARDIVELLIKEGADITVENKHGGTALSIAKARGDADMANRLHPFFPAAISLNPYLIMIEHAYTAAVQQYKRLLFYVRYYTGLHPTGSMTEDEF